MLLHNAHDITHIRNVRMTTNKYRLSN